MIKGPPAPSRVKLPLKFNPKLIVCGLAELFVILPPTVMGLPLSTNAPALEVNTILEYVVATTVSLVSFKRALPLKTKGTSGEMAMLPQLAISLQLLSLPLPPVQTGVAAKTVSETLVL